MQAQKRSRRTAFSVQRLLAVLSSAQQFQHAALGTCADGLTNQLTVLEQQQGGDAHDAELGGQIGLLVHIDLAHLDVGALLGHLVHDGLSIRQGPHQAAQKSSRTG